MTWTLDSTPARLGGDTVTIVEGSSFCIGSSDGEIVPDRPHGVFYRDTRLVSRWSLQVDGERVEPLTVVPREPYRTSFLGRVRRHGRVESSLMVERDRRVGAGLREDLHLHNLSARPQRCQVALTIESDFADLFDVKEGKGRTHGDVSSRAVDDGVELSFSWLGQHRGALLHAPDATESEVGESGRGTVTFSVEIPARQTWTTSLVVRPLVNGSEVLTSFPLDTPVGESEPARRLRAWRESTPVTVVADLTLATVLLRSQQDLGSLRIFDPRHPGRAVVAAGAPWFMALFGRDSLLSSWMALSLDQSLALGTLQTLADYQGSVVDEVSEEQPGRILHEVRQGVDMGSALGGGSVYYGTADATPLFVALLGELNSWGVDSEAVEALLPHADRALEWIRTWGDSDGDGFVEYQRMTDQGLVNQGWKDSWDGINFADGRLAEPPIALCEVQAYVFLAYLARARLARTWDDVELARHWEHEAAVLRRRFNESFWLEDKGYVAVALDRDKRPVDACTSNMGHCLWAGILDRDKVPLVAERLMAPDMFSGWGVRTLSSQMGAYNPMSYHNGSVWPHDNAIVAAGLVRNGMVDAGQRLATALLDAAARYEGRLPELFCGFDRGEFPDPVPYPTSCSPQAWAAAAPIQLVRTLLRFDPDIPAGQVRLSPSMPPGLGRLRIENVPLAGSRVALDVNDGRWEVEGLPAQLELLREAL